jgi:hypothetical protein
VIGTTDRQRKFHPICAALTTNENTIEYEFIYQQLKDLNKEIFQFDYSPDIIIADSAECSVNSFKNVFGPCTRVMCWFHMKKCINEELKNQKIDDETSSDILNDLNHIQVSTSREMFDKSIALFKKKYEAHPLFLNYFNKWLRESHIGWYEGHCPSIPSTNNANESSNANIKKMCTQYKRLSVHEFLVKLQDFIETKWSGFRDSSTTPQPVIFNDKINIDKDMWKRAFESYENLVVTTNTNYFLSSKVFMEKQKDSNKTKRLKLLTESISSYKKLNWPDFDTFKNQQTYFNVINYDTSNYFKSRCSCSCFLKKYFCHHILIVSVMNNAVTFPHYCDTTKIDTIATRGPKKRVSKALSR